MKLLNVEPSELPELPLEIAADVWIRWQISDSVLKTAQVLGNASVGEETIKMSAQALTAVKIMFTEVLRLRALLGLPVELTDAQKVELETNLDKDIHTAQQLGEALAMKPIGNH